VKINEVTIHLGAKLTEIFIRYKLEFVIAMIAITEFEAFNTINFHTNFRRLIIPRTSLSDFRRFFPFQVTFMTFLVSSPLEQKNITGTIKCLFCLHIYHFS
jgi:hypothetical protein